MSQDLCGRRYDVIAFFEIRRHFTHNLLHGDPFSAGSIDVVSGFLFLFLTCPGSKQFMTYAVFLNPSVSLIQKDMFLNEKVQILFHGIR
jgi:hypothetical protein